MSAFGTKRTSQSVASPTNARLPLPPPWSVKEQDAFYVIRDRGGQALAYIYFEDEPGRRSAAKLLSRDKARWIGSGHLFPPQSSNSSRLRAAKLWTSSKKLLAIQCVPWLFSKTVRIENSRHGGKSLMIDNS
jgi:hypothetical protein